MVSSSDVLEHLVACRVMPVADQFDLVIRHGRGRAKMAASDGVADIGIVAGRVAALGERLGPGRAEIDASGTLVFPGGDRRARAPHPGDDRPAVAGLGRRLRLGQPRGRRGRHHHGRGNTTFPAPGETLLQAHRRVRAEAEAASVTDFFLHPVLLETRPGARLGELDEPPGPA